MNPKSKFNCPIATCQACCCKNVPLPIGFLQKYKSRIKRKVIGTDTRVPYKKGYPLSEMVFTSMDSHQNWCPFLQANKKCNVYEHRPLICRNFGNGETEELTCNFLKDRKEE